MLQLQDGTWTWQWSSCGAAGNSPPQKAWLTIDGERYGWKLRGRTAAGEESGLLLVPGDASWLSVKAPSFCDLAHTPPLPRLRIDSAAYPDLVSMLRDLTTPRFGGVVTQWPAYPVPVSSPAAVSGAVDLEACLREAVEIWNLGEPEPLFVWEPGASWGVRLAHFQGSIRRPPLQIQITRRDARHRPLGMRIAAGDNYSSAASRPYAVRGMAHELGHAMLLWGHSLDRHHLLWGAAPPMRSDPSRDERRAVHLLRRLPEGLDLNRYGYWTEP